MKLSTISIVSLVCTNGVFGSASLTVTPAAGTYDSPLTVTFALADVVGLPINGIGIAPTGDTANVLATRTYLWAGAPNTLNTPLATFGPNTPLSDIADLGYGSDPVTAGTSDGGDLMSLVLSLAPGVSSATVTFTGTWADVQFNEGPAGSATFTLTPEPATIVLLAIGAAGFARRRRRV